MISSDPETATGNAFNNQVAPGTFCPVETNRVWLCYDFGDSAWRIDPYAKIKCVEPFTPSTDIWVPSNEECCSTLLVSSESYLSTNQEFFSGTYNYHSMGANGRPVYLFMNYTSSDVFLYYMTTNEVDPFL